jgi:cytochrome b subunit of formate dehydrogenase
MEDNKNYIDPENIEVVVHTTVEIKPAQVQETKTTEPKKPLGKKMWIIIGAVALVVAIVVGVVIWLASGNKDETPPEETTPIGTWYPAEYPEDYPSDADPKQEDVFYN